jgi:2-oxoglutarate ferredoxin oxidoreductase subunit alpha
MERLRRKLDTAATLAPAPELRKAAEASRVGVIYYGSTAPAMDEAGASLQAEGILVDCLRVRAFPFAKSVFDFIAEHEHVFVVEQNESAQLRQLLVNEGDIDPKKLVKVLHYDGTPITARFIAGRIADVLADAKISPLRKVVS